MQAFALKWSCLLLGIVVATATACKKDATAAQPSGNAVTVAEPKEPIGAAAAPVVAQGRSQFDEATFSLSIAPRAKLIRGQAGEVVISLTAKAPYHVNQEYPHRLRVTSARGLATASATITRDPAKVTPARMELSVPVTLEPNGPHQLDGEFSFSLCTDEKCLMEKRPLALTVDAT